MQLTFRQKRFTLLLECVTIQYSSTGKSTTSLGSSEARILYHLQAYFSYQRRNFPFLFLFMLDNLLFFLSDLYFLLSVS